MLVLGIDPGTRVTGFGAVTRDQGRLCFLSHSLGKHQYRTRYWLNGSNDLRAISFLPWLKKLGFAPHKVIAEIQENSQTPHNIISS